MVEILVDTAASVAIGTLGGSTALQWEGEKSTALKQSFLMKKVRASIAIAGLSVNEPILFGMARGDATVAQIKTALTQNQLERDAKDQAAVRDVLHETVRVGMHGNGDGNFVLNYEVSLGGGKGIPFEDGDGWQWFVFNLRTGAMTTGATISAGLAYYGVWL